ncbi:MAG: alpha/beta fold hydrolase [Deltaproteobacteria bacterium]|nr:alpha/beta fold hydrolase [Deltaproteobacteria bacterium]
MAHLDLDDARIYYETHGEGGSPVLLIMGFAVPSTLWAAQVPALSERHRVVTFDNRGAGKSEAPVGLYTMRGFAEDAIRLLDHLGLERAHVTGVSMGGMIAQELALRHRDRVRSLCLVATHAGGLRSAVPPLRGLSLFARSHLGDRRDRIRHLRRLLYTDSFLASQDGPRLERDLREALGETPPGGHRAAQLGAILRHRTGTRLGALAGLPTLIVKPADDILVAPRHSDRLHRLIPGSRLLEIADAGHGVLGQHAERLNEALLTHYARADRAQADAGSETAAA